MKWAVAQGYRADNPAGDALAAALPNNAVRRVHHKAFPLAEVGAALRKVRGSNAYRGAALAFELLVLTGTRSGEVRSAVWDDVDLESAVWTIPAERMKAGLAHRVPLSDQALALLDEARSELPQESCFRPRPDAYSATGRWSHLSTNWESAPSRMASAPVSGTGPPSAPTPRERSALAHVNRDRVEAAYRRSDLFERRRTLMQQWADYLTATA